MKSENNDTQNLPKGYFTAHIGLYVNFGHYFHAYQEAVEILFQEIATTKRTPDSIALPLLFLMRHTLELGYKFTLDEVLRDNSQFYSPCGDGHSLTSCHKTLRRWYDEMCQRTKVSLELRTDFEKYYTLAEIAISQFDTLDHGSFHFRYPVDKAGTSCNFNHADKVNLLDLKISYDGAMTLLRHTADVFRFGG